MGERGALLITATVRNTEFVWTAANGKNILVKDTWSNM